MSGARARLVATGAILTLLAFGVRLVPAWSLQNEVADIGTYRDMARTVLRGDNIYARQIFFPYTPFSQFAPAEMLRLADATGWRFDFTIKLPSILADVVATPLILTLLSWAGCSLAVATAWTLFWVLHPVPILISAFHGNLMELVPLLVVGAYLAAERARRDGERESAWLAISALTLGLAIAWRSFPVLLLPVFLLLATRTVVQAVLYCSLAAIAPGLSLLPYLVHARQTLLREILSYSGTSDFGWAAVVRGVPHLVGGPLQGLGDPVLLQDTKSLFLCAYVAVLCIVPLFGRRALGPALMLAPLLFYALYGGVAAQYYAWALPIAIAIRDPMAIPHSLLSAVAMVSFYAVYHPGILHGRFATVVPAGRGTAWVYVVANAALVVLSLVWVLSIVYRSLDRRDEHEAPTLALRWARHPWRRRASWLTAGVVLAGVAFFAAASSRRAAALLRTQLPAARAHAAVAAAAAPARNEELLQGPAAPQLASLEAVAAPPLPGLLWTFDFAGHDLHEPRSVRAVGGGGVVAIDYVGRKLVTIARDGELRGDWSLGDVDILGLDVDDDARIWTIDAQQVRVQIRASSGTTLRALDLTGLSMYNPRGLAVAGDGGFYVADTGRGRVLHLGSEGELLGELGACDRCPADLEQPSDVVVAGGDVLVADARTQQVLVLSPGGELLSAIPLPVPPDEGGYRLAALDADTFAVTGQRSVWLLHRDGSSRPLLRADDERWRGYPGSPTGVACLPDQRHLVVSDRHSRTVRAFDVDALLE